MEVSWFNYIKRLVLVAICTVIVFVVWSDELMGSKRNDPGYTIGEEFREDIAKERGSEFERTIEGILDKIVGWMPANIFISLVFGMMLEGLVEIFWPSDDLAKLVQSGLFGVASIGLGIGSIFGLFVGVVIAIFLGCFWAILYAIIFVPILIVELIICIVQTIR